MAYRLIGTRLVQAAAPRVGTAYLSTAAVAPTASSTVAPSVKDVIITLNFVDPSGARRKVPGLVGRTIVIIPRQCFSFFSSNTTFAFCFVGKTLHEICEMNDVDIGPASMCAVFEKVRSDTWTEPLYGEGPTSGFDHVLLTGNGVDTAPPKNHVEERMLRQYWEDDELYPESRLASVIVLTKAMDGMTVYVPDRLVDDIP